MMRRVRSRRSSAAAFAFGALTLSMILVGLAAWALADNQSHQRRDLRNRYVDRTVVAASLVDALFRVAFTSQARDLSTRYSGNVTSADADALVKRSQSSYAAFADPSGRVIARSRAAPAGAFPAMPSVVRVALRRGFSVGDPRNGVVNSVIAFQTPAGPRLLVQGSPVGVFRSFLAGTLRPLPTLKGSVALVLDDHGTSLGGLAYGGRPVSAPAALRRAARPLNRSQASFTQNGRKIFVGSAQLPGTTWKVVVTAPEKELYASINGAARWVEWGILVLGALALVGVSFLLYRVVKTTDRLRRSNEQLEASRLSLEERAGELERSNADLEQFAYAASHDLSEPLRTVAGFSQLLQQRYRGRLAADADEYIGHMAAGVERMQQLIDDLLLYSRVGRGPLREDDVDLEVLLGSVLEWLGPAIDERGARVTHDTLPVVRGERGQLAQVLQNLISNAIKFTAPEVTPAVHLSATREGGDGWRVSVRDNGIGVAASSTDIFKMFGRLHGADEYPGTGIGLALAKRIIEAHGGRIWVEPADGGGSVFSFTLYAGARVRQEAAA